MLCKKCASKSRLTPRATKSTKGKTKTAALIDKHVTKLYRLTKERYNILLEEIPLKGMRRISYFQLNLWPADMQRIGGMWNLENIMQMTVEKNPQSYAACKDALQQAAKELWEGVTKGTPNEGEKPHISVYEQEQSSRKFVPEGKAELSIQGKDFTLKSSWDSFSAFSPKSDFQSHNPFYMGIEEASPTSARKLYSILEANPAALKNIPYDGLANWLISKGVRYQTAHSSY